MQTQDDIDLAIENLKKKLQTLAGQNITGSKLGEMALKGNPTLRIKELGLPAKATLTHFIEKYLPDMVVRVGPQGGDSLYFIGKPEDAPQQVADYDFWLAFAKPDSKNRLGLTQVNHTLTLLEKDQLPLGVNVIESVSLIELEEIKLSFIEKERSEGPEWTPEASMSYPHWVSCLRALDHPHGKLWSPFRVNALKRLFESRLVTLGVPQPRQITLCQFMDESLARYSKARPSAPVNQAPSLKEKTQASTPATNALKENPQVAKSSDEILRLAIIDVINKMPVAELRALELPIGLLSDALQAQLQK